MCIIYNRSVLGGHHRFVWGFGGLGVWGGQFCGLVWGCLCDFMKLANLVLVRFLVLLRALPPAAAVPLLMCTSRKSILTPSVVLMGRTVVDDDRTVLHLSATTVPRGASVWVTTTAPDPPGGGIGYPPGSPLRMMEASRGRFVGGCGPHGTTLILLSTATYVASECGPVHFRAAWTTSATVAVRRGPVATLHVTCDEVGIDQLHLPSVNRVETLRGMAHRGNVTRFPLLGPSYHRRGEIHSFVVWDFGGEHRYDRSWYPTNENAIVERFRRPPNPQNLDLVRSWQVRGGLHAWSRTSTDGVTMLGTGRLQERRLDEATGLLTIGCGVTVADAEDYLLSERSRWMLRSAPAIGSATLCGAVATGAHGTGFPSISNDVHAIRAVTWDGDVRTDDLASWRMSLGRLGVVTAVTLRLVPCRPYTLTYHAYPGVEAVPTWDRNASFVVTPGGVYEERVVWHEGEACSLQDTGSGLEGIPVMAWATSSLPVPPLVPRLLVEWLRPAVRIDEPRRRRHQRGGESIHHFETELYVDALHQAVHVLRSRTSSPLYVRYVEADEVPIARSPFASGGKYAINLSSKDADRLLSIGRAAAERMRGAGLSVAFHPGKLVPDGMNGME